MLDQHVRQHSSPPSSKHQMNEYVLEDQLHPSSRVQRLLNQWGAFKLSWLHVVDPKLYKDTLFWFFLLACYQSVHVLFLLRSITTQRAIWKNTFLIEILIQCASLCIVWRQWRLIIPQSWVCDKTAALKRSLASQYSVVCRLFVVHLYIYFSVMWLVTLRSRMGFKSSYHCKKLHRQHEVSGSFYTLYYRNFRPNWNRFVLFLLWVWDV